MPSPHTLVVCPSTGTYSALLLCSAVLLSPSSFRLLSGWLPRPLRCIDSLVKPFGTNHRTGCVFFFLMWEAGEGPNFWSEGPYGKPWARAGKITGRWRITPQGRPLGHRGYSAAGPGSKGRKLKRWKTYLDVLGGWWWSWCRPVFSEKCHFFSPICLTAWICQFNTHNIWMRILIFFMLCYIYYVTPHYRML